MQEFQTLIVSHSDIWTCREVSQSSRLPVTVFLRSTLSLPLLLIAVCFVLQFSLFLTEAILMFSQQSSVVRGDRKLQVRSHWILQLLMIVCSLGGLLAIYLSKEERGKPHYTSWHGLLGLITVISCCAQALAGVVLIYPSIIKRFVSLAQAKIYHSVYGLFNYTLVTIVFNLAMRSNWAVKNITGPAWYGCIACIDVLALVIMTQITNSTLPRMRRQRQ